MRRSSHHPRTRTTLPPVALLLSLLLAPAIALPQALPQPAASADGTPPEERPTAMERLAEAYRALPRYADEGTLTVTTYEDGTERTESLFFSTRRDPLGFELHLLPENGDQTVVWATPSPRHQGPSPALERIFRYDAGADRYAAQLSLPRALPRYLGPAARQALLVPRLLLDPAPEPGDAEPDEAPGWPGAWMADADPALTTGQPCPGAERQVPCSVLTFTAPPEARPIRRVRVWTTEEGGDGTPAGLVRRVEVEGEPVAGELPPPGSGGLAPSRAWTRVEVVHRPQAPGDAEEDALPFTPPAGAQRVARLAEPAPDPQAPLSAGRAGGRTVISESIRVAELLLPVRVTDRDGKPVEDLSADDFRLLVGDEEVPIQAATWVGTTSEWVEELRALPLAERRQLGLEDVIPGRLIVIFFQTDFEPVRIKGHMAFLPKLGDLLAALEPTDRLAVASYDSHLKLWQDFTTEREPVLEMAKDAFRFGARGVETRPGNVPESLAEHLDLRAAQDAAWIEHGLAVLAEALEPFRAEKQLLFVGWGVGHNGTGRFRHGYRALIEAGVTLHALDVTYAGSHTLGQPLAAMAHLTGGTYSAVDHSPGFAVQRVTTALTGHWELSVRDSDLPPESRRKSVEFRVELRDPSLGQVENARGVLDLEGR